MSFSVALVALAWEYYRAERPGQPRQTASRALIWLMDNFNAGGERHGWLAWATGALLPALLAGAIGALLSGLWWPFGWIFEVIVLYFCLGFREATELAQRASRALQAGDLELARATLLIWRPGMLAGADEGALIRQAIEELFRQSLLRLFGVLFWFFLFGAAGAVLYLLTRLARDRWHAEPEFGLPARRIAVWLDWLPARAVAFSFAVAGNFMDAMESWRGQGWNWGDENEGILLAAGAGALGLRLGGDIVIAGGELVRPTLGVGDPPDTSATDAAIALIWRAALIWLAVIGLLRLGGV